MSISKMRSAVLAAASIVLVLLSGPALASAVYSNGAPIGDSSRCISGPGHCGGSGNWTIYDQFTLASVTTITGFSNWNNVGGSADDYVGTNWSIWNVTPSNGGSALFSGWSVGASLEDGGFLKTIIDGLDVTLAAGSYWLGINHQVLGNAWSYAYSDAADQTMQLDGDSYTFPELNAMAIEINGTVTAVPEPAGLSLIALSLLGLFGLRRRRAA